MRKALQNLKFRIAKVLYRHPWLFRRLRPIWRQANWSMHKSLLWFKSSRSVRLPDVPIRVPLAAIRFGAFANDAGQQFDSSHVVELSLDRDLLEFVKRVHEKKSFADDPYYATLMTRLNNGDDVFGVRDKTQLDRELAEICAPGGPGRPESGLPSVVIGERGEVFLRRGGLLLAFAHGSGRQDILATVAGRHGAWNQLREELAIDMHRRGGNLYQRVLHPDLDVMPAIQDCVDRLEILRAHIPKGLETVLDIGAEFGQISRFFEDQGFSVTAVEEDPKCVFYLTRIRDVMGYHHDIFPHDVRTYTPNRPVDVLVALSVLHFFTKTPDDLEDLKRLLGRLRPKVMFFQPPRRDEYNDRGLFRIYETDEFAHLVQGWAGLSSTELIGFADNRRPIYKLQ